VARAAKKMLAWRKEVQFHPYIMTKSVQGYEFPFYIGDSVAHAWYGGGNGRSPELPFIRDKMLAPGDLVFDVGAHHGLLTVAIAPLTAFVVAVEPNPHNVAILQKNIQFNHLQNVRVCAVAVGDSMGEVEVFRDSCKGGVVFWDDQSSPTTKVPLIPLDSLAEQYGFPQMLKLDVEGFENAALKGAAQMLARRPKIAIEVHVDWLRRYGSSVKAVLDLLNLDGYEVWVMPQRPVEIRRWQGEDLTAYPPPKFNLFLVPKDSRPVPVSSEQPSHARERT